MIFFEKREIFTLSFFIIILLFYSFLILGTPKAFIVKGSRHDKWRFTVL